MTIPSLFSTPTDVYTWTREWAVHTGGKKFYEVAIISCGTDAIAISRYAKWDQKLSLLGQEEGQGQTLHVGIFAGALQAMQKKRAEKSKFKSAGAYDGWRQIKNEYSDMEILADEIASQYPTSIGSGIINQMRHIELSLPTFDPLDDIKKESQKVNDAERKQRETDYKSDKDFGSW